MPTEPSSEQAGEEPLGAPSSCRLSSRAAAEPLAGTAPAGVRSWLLVEHPGRWTEDPLGGALEEWRASLESLAARRTGTRIQVLASGRSAPVLLPERGGLAEGEPRCTRLELDERSAPVAASAPLSTWLEGEVPLRPLPANTALYLVCVHAVRDRCCGTFGNGLLEELRTVAPGRVFGTTHLGGHRFAPTLVHLPSGLCLGRVDRAAAGEVVRALDAGRPPNLDFVRGRCAASAAEQVVEVELWREASRARLDQWTLRTIGSQDGETVVLAQERGGDRRAWQVRTGSAPLEREVAASCGAKPRAGQRIFVIEKIAVPSPGAEPEDGRRPPELS